MVKWKRISESSRHKSPKEVLKEFADALGTSSTNGKLKGDVYHHTYEDSEGRLRAYHSLQIIVTKLNRPYKFIEVESQKEGDYPVDVRVYYYTQTVEEDGFTTEMELRQAIERFTDNDHTARLLDHLENMGDLRDE